MKKFGKIMLVCCLLLITAIVSSLVTVKMLFPSGDRVGIGPVEEKMQEISSYLDQYFIDEYDPDILSDAAADGAAAAMVAATGDRWSSYISAENMAEYEEASSNEYVGVGIAILPDERGVKIVSVTEGGPAEEAGLQVEDIITEVDGQSVTELGEEGILQAVRGEPDTSVHFVILRGDETLELDVTRKRIVDAVAEAELLEGNIGWITISDFEQHSAEQTIQCMKDMLNSGAKALIFDVRFNGGGLKTEMLKILDVLLPAGELFRGVYYDGKEEVKYSDNACLNIPMAVLVNEDSYSAAEFFAAALQEYEYAMIVGEKTVGKGNFQYTLPLSDGSAVVLSVGKYYTPKGKSLTDVGVTPDLPVEMEDKDYVALYYGYLSAEEDVQLQAAVSALQSKIS